MKNLDLQLFSEEQPQPEPQTQQPEQQRTQAFENHVAGLQRQARDLKDRYPGLDLQQEMNSAKFRRITAPDVNLSVEEAYYALNHRQLQSEAIEAAIRHTLNAVATGTLRPQEHGLSGQGAAVSTFDYRSASREQREDLKRRIRQAAAEGRKLYPGR